MNNTENTKFLFNKYASKYQEQYMNVDLYKNSFNTFCKAISTKNASVLELGCGPGNITKYLLTQRPDFKILGIDLAPQMIELAKINNPTADFKVMNAKNITQIPKTYDGIMCGFCLPYYSKPEAIQFIADAKMVLKQHGIVYISTMEDLNSNSKLQASSHDKNDTLFINYHEAAYITKALEVNRFEIIELIHQDYPQKNGEITTDLIIIAKKL